MYHTPILHSAREGGEPPLARAAFCHGRVKQVFFRCKSKKTEFSFSRRGVYACYTSYDLRCFRKAATAVSNFKWLRRVRLASGTLTWRALTCILRHQMSLLFWTPKSKQTQLLVLSLHNVADAIFMLIRIKPCCRKMLALATVVLLSLPFYIPTSKGGLYYCTA